MYFACQPEFRLGSFALGAKKEGGKSRGAHRAWPNLPLFKIWRVDALPSAGNRVTGEAKEAK